MATAETPVPQQLPLGRVVTDAFSAEGDRLLRAVAAAVAAGGKVADDLATDLGVDPAQFSRALHGKATFSARWLPAIIYRDRTNALIRHLCTLAGGDFVPRPELTPEQELASLKRILAEAGPVGDAILRQAKGDVL